MRKNKLEEGVVLKSTGAAYHPFTPISDKLTRSLFSQSVLLEGISIERGRPHLGEQETTVSCFRGIEGESSCLGFQACISTSEQTAPALTHAGESLEGKKNHFHIF